MSVERIGRYEIVGELGEGGMAKVLHGYDPRFERDVAIKVLPREMGFKQIFRERFEREAKTIAALEHNAIVPVYDFGEEDGQPYLVMRHMTGGSLAERIPPGGLSLAETVSVIERIASALDKAHSRAIIHRDIKPSNILFDEEGSPYLSDFGIVKLAEATAQLTSGGMVGTPGYMAPEMAEQGGLSVLVDVYALGVTVYQMLSGRLPYSADTPMGILMAHMNKPIPDIRSLRPDLPDGIQALIERALAKDPADRYANGGELAGELRWIASNSHTTPKGQKQKTAKATGIASALARTQDVDYPSSHHTTVPKGNHRRNYLGIGTAMIATILIAGLAVGGWLISQSTNQSTSEATTSPELNNTQLLDAGTRPTLSETNDPTPTVETTSSNTPRAVASTKTPTIPSTQEILLSQFVDGTLKDEIEFDSRLDIPLSWSVYNTEFEDGVALIQPNADFLGIFGDRTLILGQAVLVKFRYHPSTSGNIDIHAGDWMTSTYREWGVFFNNNQIEINLKSGTDPSLFPPWSHDTLGEEPERWYVLLLGIGNATEPFLIRIWDLDNPDNYAEYTLQHDQDWYSGLWEIKFTTGQTGLLEIDRFESFNEVPNLP